jgi:hypothetical protein
VPLKSHLDVQLIHRRPVAGSLNKSSCLARTLGVTKFINMRDMILVTLCCAAQVRLGYSTNPPQFVEEALTLSCSFGCDKIHNISSYEFGHTLVCYLSQT